jgi:hypothetical protein
MIALTKILIATLISICCSLTGLNLDKNENMVKKEIISYPIESQQIKPCSKNIVGINSLTQTLLLC